jgi:hypothetical protein
MAISDWLVYKINHFPFPITNKLVNHSTNYQFRDVAQSGSAPALGAGGPRFESWYPDRKRVSNGSLFLLVKLCETNRLHVYLQPIGFLFCIQKTRQSIAAPYEQSLS